MLLYMEKLTCTGMPFTDEHKPLLQLVLAELETTERALRARCNNAPLMNTLWQKVGPGA